MFLNIRWVSVKLCVLERPLDLSRMHECKSRTPFLSSLRGPAINDQNQHVMCISAMCSPPCAHGGTCMRWNECLCPLGWTGAGCHTGTAADLSGTAPPSWAGPFPSTLVLHIDLLPLDICERKWAIFLVSVEFYCPRHLVSVSAVCELPCANGGRCVGPNICQCPSDYSGPQCLLRE